MVAAGVPAHLVLNAILSCTHARTHNVQTHKGVNTKAQASKCTKLRTDVYCLLPAMVQLGEPYTAMVQIGEPYAPVVQLGEPYTAMMQIGEPYTAMVQIGEPFTAAIQFAKTEFLANSYKVVQGETHLSR